MTTAAAVRPERAPTRFLDALIGRRWLCLGLVALIGLAVHLPVRNWGWHYVATGVQTLFSPAGLQLYSRHPELQMGPLTFVVGAVFVLLLHGPVGALAANLAMTAAGLLAVREVSTQLPAGDRTAARRWFVASALVLLVWGEVAVHWAHLDDAMALLCGVVAIRLVRSGHPLWAALAVGLAIDFKPWAVPFAAILLLAPRRHWLAAGGVLAATVAAVWGAFAVLDPASLSAARFVIPINPASTLGLLQVTGGTPAWCRPAQLLGGVALAVFAVRRGRWPAVLMLAITLRMLLDPVAKNYYDSGLVLATALFDVAATSAALPLATLAAVVTVYLPSYLLVGAAPVQALIRTLGLLGLLGAGLFAGSRRIDLVRPAKGSAHPR